MQNQQLQERDQERDEAAFHEATHIVVSAVKGRLVQMVKIWFDEQAQKWRGETLFYRWRPPSPELRTQMKMGVFHPKTTEELEAATNPPTPDGGDLFDKMLLEDKLITYLAGIEGEIKKAKENGRDQTFTMELWQAAQLDGDYDESLKEIRASNKEAEMDVLITEARREAREILASADLWGLVGEIAAAIINRYREDPGNAEWNPLGWDELDGAIQARLLALFEQVHPNF